MHNQFNQIILLALLFNFAAEAKPITAADATWLCRYNVGTGALKGKRLIACMNYSRKVLKNYDASLKSIQMQEKVANDTKQ